MVAHRNLSGLSAGADSRSVESGFVLTPANGVEMLTVTWRGENCSRHNRPSWMIFCACILGFLVVPGFSLQIHSARSWVPQIITRKASASSWVSKPSHLCMLNLLKTPQVPFASTRVLSSHGIRNSVIVAVIRLAVRESMYTNVSTVYKPS